MVTGNYMVIKPEIYNLRAELPDNLPAELGAEYALLPGGLAAVQASVQSRAPCSAPRTCRCSEASITASTAETRSSPSCPGEKVIVL